MTDQIVVQTQETTLPITPVEVSANKDNTIITETINKIKKVCQDRASSLMLEVGEIIIEDIFDNDTDQAAKDVIDSKSKSSKRELFDNMMKEFAALRHAGEIPKKTWLYNAVNLAIQQRKFQGVSGYDKLTNSHKIELIPLRDEESQKQLVEQINSKNMSVRETRDAVKATKEPVELKSKAPTILSVIKNPHLDVNVDELKYYGGKRRDKATSLITEGIEKMKKAISTLEKIEQNLTEYGTKK